MKIFMDMAIEYNDLKIVAIGAVGTAREVVAYDSEMRNRVAEIHVPLMTDDEIKQILDKGENLLNIGIFSNIKNDVVTYSNGLASVCHQMALNMCFASEIYDTVENPLAINALHFKTALERYIENESDTIKSAFDKALKLKRKHKFHNCKLILEALTEQDGDEGLTRAEILYIIRKTEPLFSPGNLTIYLKELQLENRGLIVRYDEVSGKYTFLNPFHKVFARILFSKDKRKEDLYDIMHFKSFDRDLVTSIAFDSFTKAISTMVIHEIGHARLAIDIADYDKPYAIINNKPLIHKK